MPHLKFFKNIRKTDVPEAGGKGASLGEMTNAGIPVPPGFVVLAGAFNRFLKETEHSHAKNITVFRAILSGRLKEKIYTLRNQDRSRR